jgi:hypothetical protein
MEAESRKLQMSACGFVEIGAVMVQSKETASRWYANNERTSSWTKEIASIQGMPQKWGEFDIYFCVCIANHLYW